MDEDDLIGAYAGDTVGLAVLHGEQGRAAREFLRELREKEAREFLRELKARVWDECSAATVAWYQNQRYYSEDEVPNPYRGGQ